jgi:hypothetical protein
VGFEHQRSQSGQDEKDLDAGDLTFGVTLALQKSKGGGTVGNMLGVFKKPEWPIALVGARGPNVDTIFAISSIQVFVRTRSSAADSHALEYVCGDRCPKARRLQLKRVRSFVANQQLGLKR